MMETESSTIHVDPAPEGGLIDFDRFRRAPLTRDPFEFMVVPGFVPRAIAEAASLTFAAPDLPGVLPAPRHEPNTAFGHLLHALREPGLTRAFGEKFGLALSTDTLMITLRARTRPFDGVIHTDSETKTITALIYLNTDWNDAGGRLRLLRGPNDIDDMIAEVPPEAGTLIAFRRSSRSWHGHKPYDGVRRAIMLNWMVDAATARRELRRHAVSAGIKRLFGV
jgi:hypothetical protein